MKILKIIAGIIIISSSSYSVAATAVRDLPSNYSCTKSERSSDYICSEDKPLLNQQETLVLLGVAGIVYFVIQEFRKNKTEKEADFSDFTEKNNGSKWGSFNFSPIFIDGKFHLGVNHKW